MVKQGKRIGSRRTRARGARTVSNQAGATSNRSSYIQTERVPRGVASRTADRAMLQQARVEEENYMKTLMDPCGAPLQHGPYAGSRGFISRFTNYYQLTLGAGQTAGYVAICPGSGVSSSGTYANAAAGFTFLAAPTYVPGTAFLSTNANSVRCLGACIQLWSDAAPLNITGNVFMGTLNWGELNNAGNVQNFFNLANYQGKLTADAFEQKWYPGPEDDKFKAFNTAPSSQDGGSANMIFIGVSGVPAATSFSFRITWIPEWQPNGFSGLNSPATDSSTGLVLPATVVKKLNQTRPKWFSKIGNMLNTATPYIAEGAKLAAGVAGLLL